ncbi:MAG: 3'(2'),5'-bisphosphate nucleotidase CysQ [Bryobacterales bacterium]|nr:3'(2'),5'-bisphosphate nucleotidase CysQ [Acidobacteriota bacterium]MCB9384788.1 3'(2'),5'-bisphosphate nucleotidase CysQ [Bryobacterales bacterium]
MAQTTDLDLAFLQQVAREAGAAILEVYETDFDVESKSDASPLTEADLRSHKIITARLAERYPDIPILSEESAEQAAYDVRRHWSRYFLVDPLDGTKEFVKRNGQFTVNIALIEDGRPTVGVVYAPVLDWMYWGSESGGAFKQEKAGAPQRLQPSGPAAPGKVTIVGSRSHSTPELEAYVESQRAQHGDVDFIAMGSSLKLCIIAEGKADVYPRFGPTMEWDTAAADAVVRAAGRRVTQPDSDDDLPYNKENLLNGWFIAR